MILLLTVLLQTAAPAGTTVCPDGSLAPPAGADCPRYLFFDSGKAELSRDAGAELDRVAVRVRELGSARVSLLGYSDLSGPASANLRVSRQRAELVREGLIQRGVPAGAISLQAHGEADPLVPTPDGVREPQNRRVVIRIQAS